MFLLYFTQTIRDYDQYLLDDIDDDDEGVENDDFNEKWTEDDKKLMKPILGLLMVSKIKWSSVT